MTAPTPGPCETLMDRCRALAAAWHEAGREDFARQYPHLDYDDASHQKSVKDRGRIWIAIDAGTSGAYLVRKADGLVFVIKGYGVPNLKKCVGQVNILGGASLERLRWW